MTSKELRQHLAPIMATLPAFTLKKEMLLAPIREGILHGICFESSSHLKTRFYIDVFSFPLCYPESHIYLNFGFRLRNSGGEIWDLVTPNIWENFDVVLHTQVVPYFERLNTAEAFAKEAAKYSLENPHTLKAVAFAFARAGQWEACKTYLDILLRRLDRSILWQQDIAEKSELLADLVVRQPGKAREQLLMWESETIINLGLQGCIKRRPTSVH